MLAMPQSVVAAVLFAPIFIFSSPFFLFDLIFSVPESFLSLVLSFDGLGFGLALVVRFLLDLEKYTLAMVRVNLWVWMCSIHLVLGCGDQRLKMVESVEIGMVVPVEIGMVVPVEEERPRDYCRNGDSGL
nr:hypothetical protein CFP56_42382 [Quercus suber]